MKILMMGPGGSGKGTIASLISDYLNIPTLSVGQMLRDVPAEHPWYSEIERQLNEGVLVDQEKVATLLKDKLSQKEYEKGYILDGWYRCMKDIKFFEAPVDKVFLLLISVETTLKRLSTRRTCSECGKIYSTVVEKMRPSKEGICDVCGGNLIQREDDTEEAIKKRLEIFREETSEVISYLKGKGILYEIDAEGSPEEVFSLIKPHLN